MGPAPRIPVAIPFDVGDDDARGRLLDDVAPKLLASLDAKATPAWGRMSAQQMVEHLTWLFEISTGGATVGCVVPEAQRGQWKAFLRNEMQSPRELMNPALVAGLPPLRSATIAAAVAEWNAARLRFSASSGARRAAGFVHPLLGPLDHGEWSRFHFKHVFHHLLQFGLITAA